MDWTRRDFDDWHQLNLLRSELYTSVSFVLSCLQLTFRWWLTDHAGRRPVLLCGSVAMAIALSCTGWWIYIDQAITPKAGESDITTMLTDSRGLCDCVQLGLWNELGSYPLALPT